MILINTTFCVDATIGNDFITFVRDTYIPLAQDSGLHSLLLTEMREREDDQQPEQAPTRTFALQMRAPSQDAINDFANDVLPRIYEYIGKTWGQRVIPFESMLDVLVDSNKK